MTFDPKTPLLSVVIPTVRYTELLDESIRSAVQLGSGGLEVVVNCNPWSDEFLRSAYRAHPKVRWERIHGERLAISASVNDAVAKAKGRWIVILPDDDLLAPNFLEQVDLETLSERTLVTYGIEVADMTGKVLNQGNRRVGKNISRTEAVQEYCEWRFWHHLSLFVFSRRLWDEVGGLERLGFPNGYYEDTVHHGRLVAASDGIVNIDEVLFIRRISTAQESARMYTDPQLVTGALRRVADVLMGLPDIGAYLERKHGGRDAFYRFLLGQRLKIDLYKLKRNYRVGRVARLRHAYAAHAWGLTWRQIKQAWRQA